MNEQAVDLQAFAQLRSELGVNFVRVLGYFREDAVKSIALIEEAMRTRNAVALVRPAHTLKGEALQFGALPLGLAAERIERDARDAVEAHTFPSVVEDVAELRPLLAAALAVFDRETAGGCSPVRKVVGFGRKVGFGSKV